MKPIILMIVSFITLSLAWCADTQDMLEECKSQLIETKYQLREANDNIEQANSTIEELNTQVDNVQSYVDGSYYDIKDEIENMEHGETVSTIGNHFNW